MSEQTSEIRIVELSDSQALRIRCSGVARRQHPAAHGFTLLELIITLTILGLMAGVLFSSLRLAMNSYVRSQEQLEQGARRRVLQDQIKRQIGSLFPLQPTASFLNSQAVGFAGPQVQPELQLSQVPLFDGTSESVTFITVAPLMLLENPGLTVVRYSLAQDEAGDGYLGVMETRFIGLDSFNFMLDAPEGKSLPLIEKVSRLQFAYYGYDPMTESYEWFDSWRGEETMAVPNAISIYWDNHHMIVPVNATFFGSSQMLGIQDLLSRSPQIQPTVRR